MGVLYTSPKSAPISGASLRGGLLLLSFLHAFFGGGKYLVDILLHPVAKTIDGNKIRFFISGQPDIMNVTVKELFYFLVGIDVVYIGIQNP